MRMGLCMCVIPSLAKLLYFEIVPQYQLVYYYLYLDFYIYHICCYLYNIILFKISGSLSECMGRGEGGGMGRPYNNLLMHTLPY